MPQIIPIKDLKNTSDISELCHKTDTPVFITKNGYGDMVIMSIETYEKTLSKIEMYQALEISAQQKAEGRLKDAGKSLAEMRVKYGL